MRLLHTTTYALEEFLGDEIPRYAILSHTWEGKEVTLRDMLQSNALEHLENPPSAAWEKIKNACKQARRDLWDYIWIDTCCIDKSSSAELQEAINSMFQWYAEAEMCYAFLSDLGPRLEHGPGKWKRPNVTKHRWFNRGWTLQELLAPADVYFFDCGQHQEFSSCKASEWGLARLHRVLREVSVARRMSWAAKRQTTRIEDQAYCLLGLFNINMPMLYGEGSKAFTRLQIEIMKTTDDCSLLAWGFRLPCPITTRSLRNIS
ncbi:heterokaryon incompatibility protein-domain-containing protein [Cercophora samala]|uniref:Heterokaryon incompatibility protein-domain-containing protein n=1 Tax=Cercophora samala TaxID=330535 RepID=A0AA39Z9B6_9PEZI|nr:heterokaryon incompatibility protein-domain-containing protein [Cercophora samala]